MAGSRTSALVLWFTRADLGGCVLCWRRERRRKRHEPEVPKLGLPEFEIPSARTAIIGIKSYRP